MKLWLRGKFNLLLIVVIVVVLILARKWKGVDIDLRVVIYLKDYPTKLSISIAPMSKKDNKIEDIITLLNKVVIS